MCSFFCLFVLHAQPIKAVAADLQMRWVAGWPCERPSPPLSRRLTGSSLWNLRNLIYIESML